MPDASSARRSSTRLGCQSGHCRRGPAAQFAAGRMPACAVCLPRVTHTSLHNYLLKLVTPQHTSCLDIHQGPAPRWRNGEEPRPGTGRWGCDVPHSHSWLLGTVGPLRLSSPVTSRPPLQAGGTDRRGQTTSRQIHVAPGHVALWAFVLPAQRSRSTSVSYFTIVAAIQTLLAHPAFNCVHPRAPQGATLQ